MPADVQVRAGTQALNKRLKKLREGLSDLEPTLDQIGKAIVKHTKARFDKQQTPTGKPWKRSKLAKKQRRKTLIKTGALKESIEYHATKEQLTVGSDVFYAHPHQFGAYVKPKRREDRYSGINLSVNARVTSGGVVKLRLKNRRIRDARNPSKRRTFRIDRRPFLGIGKLERAAIRETIKKTIEAATA